MESMSYDKHDLPLVQTINHSNMLSTINELKVVSESFKTLNINTSETDGKQCDLEGNNVNCIAGRINNIIKMSNIILIQPSSIHNLLYLDTPLYIINHKNSNDSNSVKHIMMGRINDIFGPIGDPMYTVYTEETLLNLLNIGENVYYFLNDADTKLMYVERTAYDTFNIVKQCTKKEQF